MYDDNPNYTKNETVIGTVLNPPPPPVPLFHVLAAARRWLQVTEPSQVQGAAFALQIGVDALLLRPDASLWAAARSARDRRNDAAASAKASAGDRAAREHSVGSVIVAGGGERGRATVALSPARITGTKEGGVGDRVCVDLIQNLGAGEGMLVGSSAKLLALVHAETFETGFVPAR